jgi:NAD(P)-dependent dehydrogenase (short-subunit alcohol dehydrogenase family)
VTRRRFSGQVAIITGAGGGIGRAHALLLASEGARVVVNDYGGDAQGNRGTSAAADQVVEEISAAGGTAVADAHDVATDGAAIVETAVTSFGGLHMVVNNAGIANAGEIDSISVSAFNRLLDIHLGGSVAVSRAAWPIMRRQGYGRIINTSSSSVFGVGQVSAYVTAKAALIGLTRALAQDGRGYGILVNALMPAAYSRLTAQSHEFSAVMAAGFPPEDVAVFAAALLSQEAPCTGETFIVGGGRAARLVLGTVPGLNHIQSIEDCLARFDQAMRTDDLYVPPDTMSEVLYECNKLGLDLDAIVMGAARS